MAHKLNDGGAAPRAAAVKLGSADAKHLAELMRLSGIIDELRIEIGEAQLQFTIDVSRNGLDPKSSAGEARARVLDGMRAQLATTQGERLLVEAMRTGDAATIARTREMLRLPPEEGSARNAPRRKKNPEFTAGIPVSIAHLEGLREAQGLSGIEVNLRIGQCTSYYSALKTGRIALREAMVGKLAEVLGTDVDTLLATGATE